MTSPQAADPEEPQRGYVYVCEPIEGADPGDASYHGGATQEPSAADYLCDLRGGYLVMSTESSRRAITVANGWMLMPATTLAEGKSFCDDAGWKLTILSRHGGHEYTTKGEWR